MKKINYKVADVIYLLVLFAILTPFWKYAFMTAKSNNNSSMDFNNDKREKECHR